MPNFQTELVKDSLLLFEHDQHDEKRQRHYQQGQGAGDVMMAEERKDDAGQKHESIKKIDKWDDEIDADKKCRKPRTLPDELAMLLQSFDHAACPALALAIKAHQCLRRACESDRGRFKADAPATIDQ